MDLDKRIKNNHRPLCVIDIKWAMGFIGKNGFFADAINCFENLSACQSGLLISVKDKKLHPFECDNQWHYTFFIPEEWVKEPEKKYRPYTFMEFIKEYPLGSHLRFRPKSKTMEMHRLIDGYNDCLNGSGTLFLCGVLFSMLELYDNYEIFKDGEWKPFGVIEE